MYSLSTLAALNSAEVKKYYCSKPLKRLLIAADVKKSPDYSGAEISEIAKHFKVKLHDTFFVDSSGFGSPNEPAYNYDSFCSILTALLRNNSGKNYYAALTGIGQFQVYVSIFYKVKRD
jgi:hypothetical protein